MNRVLITGATSGIGHQLVLDYAEQGWDVVACGRNEAVLNELHQSHASIVPCAFDITDREQALKVFQALPWVPELWILNAGNCEYIDDGEMDAQLLTRVFQTNVIGLANVIEGIQPNLCSGHRVAIVGSIASELALPRAEAYGASKAAVAYMARTLRLDWRDKGVKVSTIYPGFVETPLTAKNTFPMPMMVSVEQASKSIRKGLADGQSNIYFPAKFTWIIRLLGILPYSWQYAVTSLLFRS